MINAGIVFVVVLYSVLVTGFCIWSFIDTRKKSRAKVRNKNDN